MIIWLIPFQNVYNDVWFWSYSVKYISNSQNILLYHISGRYRIAFVNALQQCWKTYLSN